VDDALPVQPEGKVVYIIIGITKALHIMRHILLIQLHGLHIGRQLHRQQARRFTLATDDVKQCLVLNTK